MRIIALMSLLGVLLLPQSSFAVTPDEILKDPALEQRARVLSQELRCMVCQNQSIDDSDAPLAKDLRLLVRERLVKGDSDKQVLDYLVSRYGSFVLLRPPLEISTLLLWGLPPLVLLAGIVTLLAMARRRKLEVLETAALSSDEQSRMRKLTE
jgi:cytochrome c-type biogenesis protein CcmH